MVERMVGSESAEEARLDERLLQAALRRLSNQSSAQLSMRQVAHDLGVSHQAPYVHFGSKRRFLAAVAGVGLQQAAEEAAAAVAAVQEPVDKLHALADAYLAFVRTRRHVHDLAYGPEVAKRDHPLLQSAAIAYWNLLHDTVASCQPPGTREEEVLRRSAVAWGTVYGIARLANFEQIPASVPGPEVDLVHAALNWLYQGWNTPGCPSLSPSSDV
jgi:AcrR family transcriptional regulator